MAVGVWNAVHVAYHWIKEVEVEHLGPGIEYTLEAGHRAIERIRGLPFSDYYEPSLSCLTFISRAADTVGSSVPSIIPTVREHVLNASNLLVAEAAVVLVYSVITAIVVWLIKPRLLPHAPRQAPAASQPTAVDINRAMRRLNERNGRT